MLRVLFLVAVFSLSQVLANREPRTSAPYMTGFTFRSFCEHAFDEFTKKLDPQAVRRGDRVFVKSNLLQEFFEKYYPAIEHAFVLVSHNADHGVEKRFEPYLNEGKIFKWFGQNCADFSHPKLVPLPIGIANSCWRHGNVNNFNRVMRYVGKVDKHYLISYTCRDSTAPKYRIPARIALNKLREATVLKNMSHLQYLTALLRSKFVACPRGNGLDTHRAWEALYMGAYPVVLSTPSDSMYQGLPVLIISDWRELTREKLESVYREFQARKFSRERLFASYWKREFNLARQACIKSGF
ncbi:MAG: hypothetical protein MRY21_02815 [Simkaniaceae bacterium]|nr:hypothetical protein [Simkaniaceae bacterium]